MHLLPELNEERREAKVAGKYAEQGTAVRTSGVTAWINSKAEKDGDIGQDEQKAYADDVQKLMTTRSTKLTPCSPQRIQTTKFGGHLWTQMATLVSKTGSPDHVAIIMDGNVVGLTVVCAQRGHRKGVDAVRNLVEYLVGKTRKHHLMRFPPRTGNARRGKSTF